MTDDLESIEIQLASGHIFTIGGPQGEHAIYFGTVGDEPKFSNDLLDRYAERFGHTEINDIYGDHVTTLACSSSPWVLLQFPDARRNEVVANLELLLLDTA